MAQEINELILGIELNEAYSQLTYYHPSLKEPVTLEAPGEPNQYLMPMGLRQDCGGVWHFWDGGVKQEEPEEDQIRIADIYRKTEEGILPENEESQLSPERLFAVYFGLWLERLRPLAGDARLHVMVTVRELTDIWGAILTKALEKNGIDRAHIYLQDSLSSFYYYTVNQKKELWSQDVALLEYEDGAITGYVLTIDRGTRPAVARVDRVARQPMDDENRAGLGEQEWKKEKDRLFFELLKKVFERRNVSVSYLVGDYFSKSWAKRSIQFICYGRHAFQGKNLYSKGACYAAMERSGMIPGRNILFRGRDMVLRNISMEMRVRGSDTLYPVIDAGINWYEARHVCEFVLNGEREVRLISSPMASGETILHSMRLPGLPSRPDRATRVRMNVYFSSPDRCHVEVEDLGFGGLYKASGLTWKRTLLF